MVPLLSVKTYASHDVRSLTLLLIFSLKKEEKNYVKLNQVVTLEERGLLGYVILLTKKQS